MCGEPTDVGGLWVGSDTIVVCGHYCAKKVIMLALDTISSVDGSVSYAEWMRLADKSYDRWERYHVLQHENHRRFVDSLCPLCQVKVPEVIHADR